MTEGPVCIFCGRGEAKDTLPEGKPVHASCVLVGKQLVVTAHVVMKRESPVLRSDWRVIAFFRDVAHSMNIAWFRERLRHLCAYLTYLRRKFVEYRFAMKLKNEDVVTRRIVARKALVSIRRTLHIAALYQGGTRHFRGVTRFFRTDPRNNSACSRICYRGFSFIKKRNGFFFHAPA